MWEDALRVAKKASGEKAAQQVKICAAQKRRARKNIFRFSSAIIK